MIGEYMVAMEDGVRLYTLVLKPDAGAHAVVFYRTPYDPAPDDNLKNALHTRFTPYMDKGFAVVWQHCRGRGGSEGEFVPFEGERSDGLKTLSWIERQDFCDGRVYLCGGSYLSFVHLSYLAVAPACVKGAALGIMGTGLERMLFKDGAFKADLAPIWYMGLYRTKDLLLGDPRSTYDAQWRKYPLREFPVRAYGYPVPQLDEILKGNEGGSGISEARYAMSACPVPVLLRDGWGEMFLNAMAPMWRELPEDIRQKSAFVMGPWAHPCRVEPDWKYPLPGGNEAGDSDLAWFLHLRDGAPSDLFSVGKVRYYHIGAGVWEDSEDFPQAKERVTLHMTGGGALSADAPEAGEISYRYDPADPPFFPGGPESFCTPPLGFAEQPQPNFREDVVSFMTAPLEADMDVVGGIRARLRVRSDKSVTSFVMRLVCVHEDGAAVMQEALCRVRFHSEEEFADFRFDPVCWRLRAGERLRVDVASADAANYFVEPNVEGEWYEVDHGEAAVNALLFPGCVVDLPVKK